MLTESAISSFLGSVRAVGIAVPQGLRIVDKHDRVSSEASPPATSQARLADRSLSQGGGFCNPVVDAAAASPSRSWIDDTMNVGASTSRSDLAQRAVSFVEESSVG